MTTDYNYLRRLLKAESGLALSDEKQYLVESRLLPLARRQGLGGLPGLVSKLREPGASRLTTEVVEAMMTNESSFFRDKVPFDHFRDVIMPALLNARAAQKRIRIWCAACSTGQEPYSLAMALLEMGSMIADYRVEILATDISADVVEKAKAGLYSQFEIQRGLPIHYLLKYFTQRGEAWQVIPQLRAMVAFRTLNLLHALPSSGLFDVVFCRNVMIYFDQPTKAQLLDRLKPVMARDGYLVLGAAETVVGLTKAFRPIDGRRGLYAPCDANVVAFSRSAAKKAV